MPLIIEGQEIVDTETGVPTDIFQKPGYCVDFPEQLDFGEFRIHLAGTKTGLNNNHLDGAVITGNKFTERY